MPSDKCVSHYHITLENCTVDEIKKAAELIEGKVTTIDLIGGPNPVKDRMLTKWQKGADLSEVRSAVIKLASLGYNVVRFKLERMLNTVSEIPSFNITEANYLEVHVKVPSTVARENIFPFVLSSNAKDIDHYFYNSRARTNEQAKVLSKILEERFSAYPTHIEYVVYDSNPKHDRWWA